MRPNDTIFALSTPAGRGAVAIIRISGPASGGAIKVLAGRLPEPRRATLTTLIDPVTKDLVDRAVVLWFPGPASFTGEDLAELHIHGSPAVCRRIFEVLQSNGACRLANPGEFTRRAFENDRLDLAEAEGIADLIDADSEAQRRQALMQLSGGIADATENWKQRIAHCLAHVEALIDFADDGVPDAVIDKALQIVLGVAAEIKEALDDGRRGERIREGVSVAIIGPPNSGKSSLLNALAGQDVAIVSDRPGTTRDVLEVRLRLCGNVVNLGDTAGIRETADSIEQEGIIRARRYREGADLTLLVLDITRPEERDLFIEKTASDEIVVWNKCDLLSNTQEGEGGSYISVRTGEGIESLLDLLANRISSLTSGPAPVVTRARHRNSLTEAHAALDRMFHVKQGAPELIAEELRLALRAIGSLTGAVGVEDLLDLIFKDFCIGK